MSVLAEAYQVTANKRPEKPLTGLDQMTLQAQGWWQRRRAHKSCSLALAEQIQQHSLQYRQLSRSELEKKLQQRQAIHRRGKSNRVELKETLALLTEAADRTLQLRPYPEQILATQVLHRGELAEMATGEGKSLVTCLTAILAGWSGKPCHVITANDYLAARDAQHFTPLFTLCALTVGATTAHMSHQERALQYRKSIVYTTSKELLADYLRDQIAHGTEDVSLPCLLRHYLNPQPSNRLLHGLHTAIVDEADNVLIDEATTPLIISQPQPNAELEQACRLSHQLAKEFEAGRDYQIDSEQRQIRLTRQGENRLQANAYDLPPFFRNPGRVAEMVRLALTAREFFHPGQQYLLEQGRVVIVDPFTGRKMSQRSWQRGLQQMIEIKEGVELSQPMESLAQMSFQAFFNRFQNLCGTTGTAWETRRELWTTYRLVVVRIPLHRPEQRTELPARTFPSKQEKLAAILAEVQDCYRRGQPVLIGSRTIQESEQISTQLQQAAIPHQLLNARQDRQEAEIIARAGQRKQVTVATNMAGRGADIKLGEGVDALGGMHVIVSEPHESKRIDRQLIGRSARQGKPGSFRIYRCAEDEILQRSRLLERLAAICCSKPNTFGPLVTLTMSIAQFLAQRQAYRQRRELSQRDQWLTEQLPSSATSSARNSPA